MWKKKPHIYDKEIDLIDDPDVDRDFNEELLLDDGPSSNEEDESTSQPTQTPVDKSSQPGLRRLQIETDRVETAADRVRPPTRPVSIEIESFDRLEARVQLLEGKIDQVLLKLDRLSEVVKSFRFPK